MARELDAPLHIAVLPWLAAGHLTPFVHLSARLALLGHRVSFLSTPSNIRRLPSPLPPNLHPVALPPSLPLDISTTADLSGSDDQPLRSHLRRAFDTLSSPLSAFLRSSSPPLDWLLCDYSPYWAPQIARSLNVKSALISLFNAAVLSYLGPADELMHTTRLTLEDLMGPPKWVPFATTVAFRRYEARTVRMFFDRSAVEEESEAYRFGTMVRDCDIVAVRSCVELEKQELELLKALYKKPVIPIGHFPPAAAGEDSDEWAEAFEWLDEQAHGSVVYVAFGSEVRLQEEEIREIARGLELSGLPFVWALRRPNGPGDGPQRLPESFEGRTRGRGIVCRGWVPQVRILAHRAVGGFLTHCGWNSVVEGLCYGRTLGLMPMIFDQGLNARMLAERGVGVEVPRDEDGKFDAIGIAKTLKLVMVEEEGEPYRAKARELKSALGDEAVQGPYVKQFVEYLKAHRPVGRICSHSNMSQTSVWGIHL